MPIGQPPKLSLPEGWEDHIVPFDMPIGSPKADHWPIMAAIKAIYKARGCRGSFTHDEPTAFERYLLRLQGPAESIVQVVLEMQQLNVNDILARHRS